ncbi:MAG: hypothetical protein HC927_13170 [Deltaproteobacteria bacterium]|nr:hypothetical protein [Deltaproteobacteria bacterium]
MGERGKKHASLRVELDAPASPARVLAAVQMLSASVEALDPSLPDGAVTLVVNNFDLRSELRSSSDAGSVVVDTIADVLERPDKAVERGPEMRDVALHLAKGFDAMGEALAAVFRGADKKPVAKVSSRTFAAAMKDAAKKARPTKPQGEIRVRTSVYTPIIRFGRKTEDARPQARIMAFGDVLDVDVPEHLVNVCAALTASDEHIHVEIEGRWGTRNGRTVLVDAKLQGIDGNDRAMTSEDFIEFVRANATVLTPKAIAEMQARLRESREVE